MMTRRTALWLISGAPLAVAPAALFVGLLEAGAQSMQRQIGVPSALVVVIEGLTMLFVLAATVRRV